MDTAPVTVAHTTPVELFWTPGCTSCLRMKEFVEARGIAYESRDFKRDPVAAARRRELGGIGPVAVVGDRFALGGDLAAVADLLGIAYEPPVVLPVVELRSRYHVVVETLCRLTQQAEGDAALYRRPERDRTTLDIAFHAAMVMRLFLQQYDPDRYARAGETYGPGDPTPPEVHDVAAVIDQARAIEQMFETWWERDGHDDPLDEIIETYWGHQTAHEAFEREVWHAAQHTRQVALFLEEAGVTPDRPLGPAELAGLPIPEEVFS